MRSVLYVLLGLVAVGLAAPDSRIVGGTPTTIEQHPYMVSIQYYYVGPGLTIQRCVGVLVSSWHVLTSGFCFTGAILENMQIRAGSTSSLVGGTLVGLDRFTKHSDYVESPREGDIALCFLERALGISNTINVLYLPPDQYNLPDGTGIDVISWGFETESGTPQLDLLKTMVLNKMNIEQCQAIYADKADEVVINGNEVICGAAAGKSMCRGDSGAPMVVNNNVVLGLSSYYGSCDDELPSVFVRVSKYSNWILEVAATG